MGGRVLFALSIAAFPEELPREVMTEIFAGASSKVREAGGTLAGGHTIKDPEPKYGLAVIGAAHPDRLLRKGGARPGDRLVLTKRLGTGVIVSGSRQGKTSEADLAAAIDGMRTLNRAAADALVATGVAAATDVTGFGLLGHGLEMARGIGHAVRHSRRRPCRSSPVRATWPPRGSRPAAPPTTAGSSPVRSRSARTCRPTSSPSPTTPRPRAACSRPSPRTGVAPLESGLRGGRRRALVDRHGRARRTGRQPGLNPREHPNGGRREGDNGGPRDRHRGTTAEEAPCVVSSSRW